MTEAGLNAKTLRRIEREAAALKPSCLAPDRVPWDKGPDTHKFWIPESQTPLPGSALYGNLTDEQRLRYNQYFALEVSEEFIWLETYALVPVLKGLLKGKVPTPAFRVLLESFVVDEENHTAAVWKLLRMARPDLYPKNDLFFFKPPPTVVRMATLTGWLPRFLSGWSLFAGLCEEKTINISRSFQEAGDDVDPLFATVFTLHALDEARHCKIDSLIAEWLIAPQRKVPKWINGKILGLYYGSYRDQGWGCDGPIRQLVADFPRLRGLEADMIKESERVFVALHYDYVTDRTATPITARNAERYEMLDRAIHRVATPNEL